MKDFLCMDYYELSMANALADMNNIENINAVFEMMVREFPFNDLYSKEQNEKECILTLTKKNFLINVGINSVLEIIHNIKFDIKTISYLKSLKIKDEVIVKFLNGLSKLEFYGMQEGTIFFEHEPQVQVIGDFSTIQFIESFLLSVINNQTTVATNAFLIKQEAKNKILLEGGSRRASSPQTSLYNSRAAIIGGFDSSSNVMFGEKYNTKVSGTNGHSFIMLFDTEFESFKYSYDKYKNDCTFLIDTYNSTIALYNVVKLVQEKDIKTFKIRIDSGNLLEEAKKVHKIMKENNIDRNMYKLICSDDLTKEKIKYLEENNADIDIYLVGTYLVNNIIPTAGVFKMVSKIKNVINTFTMKEEIPVVKNSSSKTKSTKPFRKQVIRLKSLITGKFIKDIIIKESETEEIYRKIYNIDTTCLFLINKLEYKKENFESLERINKRINDEYNSFENIKNYKTEFIL